MPGHVRTNRCKGRPRWKRRGPEIVVGVVVASLVGFAVALAFGLSSSASALVCAALLLAAALFAVFGWHRARSRAASVEAASSDERNRHRDDQGRLERHVRRLEDERDQAAQLLERLRRSWQAEREWSRELRDQIQRMQAMPGTREEGGDDRDVRALILKAAIRLVEAEKGLLISHEDDDSDGALDVILFEGFEHDPSHSAIAQRFARAVLARDEILRE